MGNLPLTAKQSKALEKIKKFIKKNGYSPTNREVAELIGTKSTGSVNDLLGRMETKGYLKRGKNWRGLKIKK